MKPSNNDIRDEEYDTEEPLSKLFKYIIIGVVSAVSFVVYVLITMHFELVPSDTNPFHMDMLIFPLISLTVCAIIYAIGRRSRTVRKYLPWIMIAILAYYIGMFTR